MYFGESIEPKLFFENYINFDIDYIIYNLENNITDGLQNNLLKPVFILLTYCDTTFDHIAEKFVKGQQFWHAIIGFDYTLTDCYSFNYNPKTHESGLIKESILGYKEKYPNANCQISCIFIGEEKYYKLKESLNYYIFNKDKTRYDFLNLFFSLIGKQTKNGLKLNQVCSTFVDSLLRSIGVNLVDKNTNLVKPDDLIKKKDNKKQFILYQGIISKFNSDRIFKKVVNLSNNSKNDYFK